MRHFILFTHAAYERDRKRGGKIEKATGQRPVTEGNGTDRQIDRQTESQSVLPNNNRNHTQ